MNGPTTDPRSFHVPASSPPEEAEAIPVVAPEAPKRRRRRWPWVVGLVVALSIVPLYVAFVAWSSWAAVERVELGDVLAGSSSATNYLFVGTDSRDGLDDDIENAGFIFGAEGERTDTIAVLQVDGDEVHLLAIPRDLWVDVGGSQNRVNAAFAFGGPEQLIRTVQGELGIGIDHYLEVDFAGFLSLVDALGGVTIDFPHAAHDPKSGLVIDEPGPRNLDGDEALAYVRSRNYTENIDGVDQRDGRSDLGRVERQQRFLAAVFAKLGATKNPFTLLDALDSVAANVRVDESLGLRQVLSLGWTVRGVEPSTATLPTSRFITAGGADVLLLDDAEAAALLVTFR